MASVEARRAGNDVRDVEAKYDGLSGLRAARSTDRLARGSIVNYLVLLVEVDAHMHRNDVDVDSLAEVAVPEKTPVTEPQTRTLPAFRTLLCPTSTRYNEHWTRVFTTTRDKNDDMSFISLAAMYTVCQRYEDGPPLSTSGRTFLSVNSICRRSILRDRYVCVNDTQGYDAGAERSITLLHVSKLDFDCGEKGNASVRCFALSSF